jgi:hypothetical protein
VASLGDLVVNLSVNSNQLTSGLAKSRASIASFAGKASMLMAPLAGVFTFKAMIDSASEAQIELRKLESVLTATGGAAGVTVDEISKFADARMAVTDFNDEVTKSAASILASFKTISGPEFFRTLELAQDLSVVMGTDMVTATKSLGKALADPVAGMSKLSRLGVTFTEEQKELIKTMQASGDMAGAQGVILDALAAKVGGAAEAVSTPIARMKSMFGEVAESLGKVFLPTLELLTQTFANLMSNITTSADGTERMGKALAEIAGPVLSGLLAGASVVAGAFTGLQAGITGLTAKFAKLRAAGAQLDVWTGGGEEAQARLDYWNALAETAGASADALSDAADAMIVGGGDKGPGAAVRAAQEDLERRKNNLPKMPMVPVDAAGMEDEDSEDSEPSKPSGGSGGSDIKAQPMWSKTLIDLETKSLAVQTKMQQDIARIAGRNGGNEVEDLR